MNKFLTNLVIFVFGSYIKLVFEAPQMISFGLKLIKITQFKLTINILGFMHTLNTKICLYKGYLKQNIGKYL